MKNNDALKISDEMIGLDEPNSWINWCVNIADDMIMAGKRAADGQHVTGQLAVSSKVNSSSSMAVKKMAKSSKTQIQK